MIYIYNLSSQRSKIHILLIYIHGRLSKIDYMIGHKTSLNKFKKAEIIPTIFSDDKDLKLEINLKEKIQKHPNSWKMNSMLLNNEYVNNEIKEEIKKHLETNENKHTSV